MATGYTMGIRGTSARLESSSLHLYDLPVYNLAMCYYCGEAIPSGTRFGFGDTCLICGKDQHICLQCAFYMPGAHWDCRETIDAPVADKERRNFCDWFSLDPRLSERDPARKDLRSGAAKAKASFSSLFGD